MGLSAFETLFAIFLAWLLGLLSPVLVERIRRGYRISELSKAIRAELEELRYGMANAWILRSRDGSAPDDFLDWFERSTKDYNGLQPKMDSAKLFAELRKIPQEQRKAILGAKNPDRGLSLKEYSLPLLAAHLGEIAMFPLPFQAAALQVRFRLDLFNQHVRNLQGHFDRTFTVSGDYNINALRTNLEEGYRQLATMAITVADTVAKVPRA